MGEGQVNFEDQIITLTDDNGVDTDYEVAAQTEYEGNIYVALFPIDYDDTDEYVILKYVLEDDGTQSFTEIEYDEDFEAVSDILSDILYDGELSLDALSDDDDDDENDKFEDD